MNAIVPAQPSRNEQKKLMLLDYMADRYSLDHLLRRRTPRMAPALA